MIFGREEALRLALVVVVGLGSALALAGLVSCAEPVRYRVLSMFFDGVPLPGQRSEREVGYAPPPGRFAAGVTAEQEVTLSRKLLYAHAPYRENRCGSCHDPGTGEVYRSDRDGLCRSCHTEVTSEPTFLHGPVAVEACLFCHHPHGSGFEGLLLADTNDTCYRCHAPGDLTGGAHHVGLDERRCTVCHDPHGGQDRFFLLTSDL